MKFGIFFELSTPRPFSTAVEWSVYHNALEQCRLADELGFDHVWAVEHHFLEEYSHCSAPEVFLAAVAAQTQRIRVGHGAVVCVPEMNHPIRVAERAAALDIISNGRLEFGTARSSTWTELGGFCGESRRHQEDLGRVRPRAAEDVDEGRIRVAGQGVFDAVAQRAAETVSAAASADVGDGDDAGHRTRRGRPRPRLPRCVGGGLRRAGAAHEGISPTHRAVRSRWADRQRPGPHDELPVLPRGLSGSAQRRRADGQRVQRRQRASVLDARSVPDARVSDARQRRRRDEGARSRRRTIRARRKVCPKASASAIPITSCARSSAGSRSASPASTSC